MASAFRIKNQNGLCCKAFDLLDLYLGSWIQSIQCVSSGSLCHIVKDFVNLPTSCMWWPSAQSYMSNEHKNIHPTCSIWANSSLISGKPLLSLICSQCGNFSIFLSFRFYVKSILAKWRGSKMGILTIFEASNFDFQLISVLTKRKHSLNQIFKGAETVKN